MATVEERLQRLEDLEEIRQLLEENARCLDAGDHAGYAGLFTEDGVLAAQLGEAKGREAIRELLDARLKDDAPPCRDGGEADDRDGEAGAGLARARGSRRTSFHHVGSATIEVDGDRAASRVIWLFLTHDDAGYPLILQSGHYDDVLVRDGGRWRYERRTITRDFGFSPLDERADFGARVCQSKAFERRS
jgi:hypothetical protein